jgi:hypothetical protein
VIDTYEHAGDFKEWWVFTRITSHFSLKNDSAEMYRTRIHSLTLLITVALALLGCTKSPADKLVGEWKGTDSGGKTASVIFSRDGTFRMVSGNLVMDGPTLGGNVEWRIDATRDPIELNVVVTPRSGKQTLLPMIIRFVTDRQLQLRISRDMQSRPTSFSVEDTENQLILEKQ